MVHSLRPLFYVVGDTVERVENQDREVTPKLTRSCDQPGYSGRNGLSLGQMVHRM
jgi:hypothetical protein